MSTKVIPSSIRFSDALKPISQSGVMRNTSVLPTTASPYKDSSICRIPIMSQSWLDAKDAFLRFKLTNNGSASSYLDGNAMAVIRRVTLIGPDGSQLEYLDNYNRLMNLLLDAEANVETRKGVFNALMGTSKINTGIQIRTSATANQLSYYLNDTFVGSHLVGGPASSIRVGDFIFSTNTTAGQIVIKSAGASTSSTLTLGGGVASAVVNGVRFDVNSTAGQFVVNGQAITTGTAGSIAFQYMPKAPNAWTQTEVITASGSKYYSIPVPSFVLQSLKTYLPTFAIGGGGLILEILFAPANEVFQTADGSAPAYQVDDVALITPSITYDGGVQEQFSQMVASAGSVSMSALSYQTQVYPYASLSSGAGMSIPLSFKYQSLKSILVAFVNNQADNSTPACSARDFVNLSSIQMRIGANYYPAMALQGSATRIGEHLSVALQGLSKLNDPRLSSLVSYDSWVNTNAGASTSFYGIDLDTDQPQYYYSQSGVDLESTPQQAYLDLNFGSSTATAGNVYIFGLFDCTLSLLANKNIVLVR